MRIKTFGGFLLVALIRARGVHASNGANGTVDQTRIVGGSDAEIGAYPFFVEWEGCGASLIHKGNFVVVPIDMLTPIDTLC